MNKEEILKIARRFFREEPVSFPAASHHVEWTGSTEDLLSFAEVVFDVAYDEGHDDGLYEHK